ncbi:MAG: hypothetical protein M1833_002817 [Piccolia ochrophora]|nr:MAG: hypothetical protein M1833_002817 [Piccolia ochrophora]
MRNVLPSVLGRPLRTFQLPQRPVQREIVVIPTHGRGSRGFHVTSQRPFLDTALTSTHAFLESVHAVTGLPWVASLPLAAIVVRLTLVTPLSIYNRKSQQRQLELQPLLKAWQLQFRRSVIRQYGSLGPVECDRRVAKALRSKRKALYKDWKCGWWRNYLPIGQLPVFLVMIEAIRRMCGAREGLLGMISQQVKSPVTSVATSQSGTLEPTQSSDILNSLLTPSLSSEGAFWFENLLMPDPMLILPFVLSGSLLTNIFIATRVLSKDERPTRFRRILSDTMKLFALAIGPATLQVPSALLVYWISSSIFACVQNVTMDKLLPLRPPLPRRKRGPPIVTNR